MSSKWPSIRDQKPAKKTDVYYDKHMKGYVPIVKKAKSKKKKSQLAKLKIRQA